MRVLITGANRGIGRALYDGYVARGDEVIATTRNQASDGWLQLDVTDPASVSAIATQLKGQAIDLLICDAGVYLDKGKELGNGYTSNVWADTFAANVTGVFLTIEALLSNLRAVGGKVAIISSQMGSSERAGGNAFAYRASKAALNMLVRTLAIEWQRTLPNTCLAAYHPGTVDTKLSEPFVSKNSASKSGTPRGKDILSPAAAAEHLLTLIPKLTPQNTGTFWDWRHNQISW